MSTGYFVTFEGGEGAGKSTQIELLATSLREAGYRVLVTREPGGSPGAEAVRHVLLSGAAEGLGSSMEAILFATARSDHVEQVIRPAVEAGYVVLADRFMDSSRVYQGMSGKLDKEFMSRLEEVAINGMQPDLTLILDLPAKEGLKRAARRRGADNADRYEKEQIGIHEDRRKTYLQIARDEPDRCIVIDGTRKAEQVHDDILKSVMKGLEERSSQDARDKKRT